MSLSPEDFRFWKSVMDVVDAMESSQQKNQMTKKDLLQFLEGLQDRLQKRNDPLENFEVYVTHRLCRVLSSAVETVSK